jgi:hypothetical protein
MVAAGLKRDVNGGTRNGFGCAAQGVHFRMVTAEPPMVAFADDPVVLDDYRADHGVGADPFFPAPGQLQSPLHVEFIRHGCFFIPSSPKMQSRHQELFLLPDGQICYRGPHSTGLRPLKNGFAATQKSFPLRKRPEVIMMDDDPLTSSLERRKTFDSPLANHFSTVPSSSQIIIKGELTDD